MTAPRSDNTDKWLTSANADVLAACIPSLAAASGRHRTKYLPKGRKGGLLPLPASAGGQTNDMQD